MPTVALAEVTTTWNQREKSGEKMSPLPSRLGSAGGGAQRGPPRPTSAGQGGRGAGGVGALVFLFLRPAHLQRQAGGQVDRPLGKHRGLLRFASPFVGAGR